MRKGETIMAEKRTFYIPLKSEGFDYFVEELMPNCKDLVEQRFVSDSTDGKILVEFKITNNDFYRIHDYIQKRDGLA